MLERASVYADNEWVRRYLASQTKATDVLGRDTLAGKVTPMSKKLTG